MMAAERERRSHDGPWIQTASGRKVSLTAPTPADVSIFDIAAHLAKVCRFNGACTLFYSVAQHSVLVSEMFGDPDQALQALLHDGHEAYLGDPTTPLKRALFPDRPDRLAVLADRHDYAIRVAVGIAPQLDDELATWITHADRVALATERRDLLEHELDWKLPLPDPLPQRIRPLTWDRAEQLFLRRFRELCTLAGVDPERTLRRAPSPFSQPHGETA
jgi:hypothetical protein